MAQGALLLTAKDGSPGWVPAMIVAAAALWAPRENLKSRSRQSLPQVHLPVARACEAGDRPGPWAARAAPCSPHRPVRAKVCAQRARALHLWSAISDGHRTCWFIIEQGPQRSLALTAAGSGRG